MNCCVNCDQPTKNKKFCTRSCSASFNNKKRLKHRKCSRCDSIIQRSSWKDQRLLCDNCNTNSKRWDRLTLGEVKDSSKVRRLARAVYTNSDKPSSCIVCGYDKHVEICHLKAISKHSANSPISKINKLDNLIAMCPNHHWELDNGMLDLSEHIDNFHEFEAPRSSSTNKCIDCNSSVSRGSKRCMECSHKVTYKFHVTKEELQEFLSQRLSYIAIGKKFGVSGAAVSKRCKKFGISR